MDQEMNNVATADNPVLNSLEIDTIGEILNISMGSAATAISTMLDQQVVISTPNVEVRGFSSLDFAAMEPAMLVKINYIQGLYGANIMVFRQKDMQVILALLMGNEVDPDEEFVFDELSISAACEVMNQMMGASATALSDFLGRAINISTPEAIPVQSRDNYQEAMGVVEGEEVIAVAFQLTIEGVMDSNFASIMTVDLAKDIVGQLMGEQERAIEELAQSAKAAQAAQEAQAAQAAAQAAQPAQPPMPPYQEEVQPPYQAPYQPPMGQAAPPQAPPAAQSQPPMPPQALPRQMDPAAMAQQPYPYGAMSPQGYPDYAMPPYGMQYPYPPYGYPGATYPSMGDPHAGEAAGYGQPQSAAQQQPVHVQTPQFPQFAPQATKAPETGSNMDLLMQVSLDVSVEIGKAKRKIKEIVDFGQGSVIELNKQAGAPVDIVVNGCLLARGDVVVIDDNFGVRITEIVGAKELMDSLKEENGL